MGEKKNKITYMLGLKNERKNYCRGGGAHNSGQASRKGQDVLTVIGGEPWKKKWKREERRSRGYDHRLVRHFDIPVGEGVFCMGYRREGMQKTKTSSWRILHHQSGHRKKNKKGKRIQHLNGGKFWGDNFCASGA